jgi:hypothetical protein
VTRNELEKLRKPLFGLDVLLGEEDGAGPGWRRIRVELQVRNKGPWTIGRICNAFKAYFRAGHPDELLLNRAERSKALPRWDSTEVCWRSATGGRYNTLREAMVGR